MTLAEESLKLHYEKKGKYEIVPTVDLNTSHDLSLAYTPGVAAACLEIQKDVCKSFELTRRWNSCLVITDGTAVLGLGDIGPEAGMPVMEGKAVLFKKFGNVDAVPLCIKSKDVDEIVNTISLISGSFGGINLEDISAPRCFEIEQRLKERCEIPVFHDDQHGTAVVVLAAIINSLKITGKDTSSRVVINGAGAAGIAICKLLLSYGFRDILLCDRTGIIHKERSNLNAIKTEMAAITNRQGVSGSLEDALKNADIFIGVSAPGSVSGEMVSSMNNDAILFAMANPVPEIMPDEARAAGARIVGTGRSDFDNQINNVLVFPGMFRGAFDVRAKEINEEMKIAAANALASLVTDDELSESYIIPNALNEQVGIAVAEAVADAAKKSGVAQI